MIISQNNYLNQQLSVHSELWPTLWPVEMAVEISDKKGQYFYLKRTMNTFSLNVFLNVESIKFGPG